MSQRQCPLLERCRQISGIDCTDRNFDGKQPRGNIKWLCKEPCSFYENIESEKRKKPKVARKQTEYQKWKANLIYSIGRHERI